MDNDLLKIAKRNINKSIDNYLKFVLTCDWTDKESYKFEFANWINSKISLTTDTNRKIFNECIKSQERLYTHGLEKGIQFLKSSGRLKRSEFFSLKDVKILKSANEIGLLNIEESETRSISFTGLSGWLGTLSPSNFIPAPVSDFNKVFIHLFNLQKVPKNGFPAFSDFQKYSQIIREEFKNQKELEWIYLNHINSYRTSIKLKPKKKYDLYDLNWVVEDFILYVHRIELDLYDTSYLTHKILPPTDDSEPNSRTPTLVNLIDRDNSIVKELKSIYNNSCQICSLSSNKNKKTFVEGAHIRPLGGVYNGNDSLDNLLCLCPNHHKLFDLGEFWIDQNFNIIGLKEFKSLNKKHLINLGNLNYHKTEIYDKEANNKET